MTPKQLKSLLVKTMRAKLPVLVKGAPGIGKSDVIAQVAEKLKMDMVLFHPVVCDPTDFKGLPGIVNGKASFLPFGDLKSLINATKPTIAFLDDLGQAPAVVQAAAMQLILARQVNGHKISDEVVFIAATNRKEDRAGVTGLLSPVKSRFAAIVELDASLDDWIEWAFENDMPSELIGFTHFRPELFNSAEATPDIVNGPCPRTIAFAGKLINAGITNTEALAGAVGEGYAIELAGFIKMYKALPSIAGILKNPKKAEVPTESNVIYATVSALVGKANDDTIGAIYKYGQRLSGDFLTLLMKDMIRKDADLQETDAFIDWATKNPDILM